MRMCMLCCSITDAQLHTCAHTIHTHARAHTRTHKQTYTIQTHTQFYVVTKICTWLLQSPLPAVFTQIHSWKFGKDC